MQERQDCDLIWLNLWCSRDCTAESTMKQKHSEMRESLSPRIAAVSQRGDDVIRERFRSKSGRKRTRGRCRRRSGRRRRRRRRKNEKEEVDLHKRSWLGRASRVSPRVGPERRKLHQELPESARLAASLRAFSTGRRYCSHERATIAATITSSSRRTTSLCSLLLAAWCGWFVLLARYLPGTLVVFSILMIILLFSFRRSRCMLPKPFIGNFRKVYNKM